MVNKRVLLYKARCAFTMIELIFAIVVIGVTLLTVPLMIETNNKAMERNLVQEAIFLASSLISVESTQAWDANSIVPTGNPDDYVLSKILDTSNIQANAVGIPYGRVNLGTVATPIISNIRQGGIMADKHRQFYDFNASAGAANNGFTIPQQVGTVTFTLAVDNSLASATDYKQAYGSANNAKRMYVADGSNGVDVFSTVATGTSNLKMIEVSVPVAGDIPQVVLRAYTANIGEADYVKRSF